MLNVKANLVLYLVEMVWLETTDVLTLCLHCASHRPVLENYDFGVELIK